MAMMTRRDELLYSPLEVLDAHFAETRDGPNKFREAWESLNDDEMKFIADEIYKCKYDVLYYLSNYHCIKDEHGNAQTLYPLWPHQQIVYEAMEREQKKKGCYRLIILKPRQCGGTVFSAGVTFHSTIFTERAFSLMMAQGKKTTAEIYRKIWDSYNSLPWWMRAERESKQQEVHIVFQRENEKERMTDPGLASTLIISNAQEQAGVAIGRSIRFLHGSEVSRWPDTDIWTSDIEPAMNARDTKAFLESTAYGRQGLFFHLWNAAESGESEEWTPVFIPVYRVPKYFLPVKKSENFTLTEDEKNLRDQVKLQEDFTIQKGFFKWRRRKIKAAIHAQGDERGEFSHQEAYPVTPGEAFISSGSCAFPRRCLNEQEREFCRDPILIGEIEYTGPEQEPELHLHKPTHEECLSKSKRENRLWIWELPDENSAVEYYCIPDGELVHTDEGEIPVEEIKERHKLLDADGNYVGINALIRRRYKGDVFGLKLFGSYDPVRVTPEHPILVRETAGHMVWKKACELRPYDWVRFPRKNIKDIDIKDLLSMWPDDSVRIDFRVDPKVILSKDFWWVVGLWLGDGWCEDKNKMAKLTIALNDKKERDMGEKLKKVIFDLTGKSTSSRVKTNALNISWHSTQMAEFFTEHFGEKSYGKKIPDWVHGLPKEWRIALLEGYLDSDGSIVAKPRKGRGVVDYGINFVSVSKTLLRGVQDIFLSLGYILTLSQAAPEGSPILFRGRVFKARKKYQLNAGVRVTQEILLDLGWEPPENFVPRKVQVREVYTKFEGDYSFRRVSSVEVKHYDGWVNNFETETHSFCVGHATTHNCGGDVASGTAKDFSDLPVYRIGYGLEPNVQVAEWHGWINASYFARICAAIGYWYHTAELAVEFARDGITTCNELRVSLDYPSLYRWRHMDKLNVFTQHIHWLTNSQTRDDAINRMGQHLLDKTIIIRNKHTIQEMRDFGRYENEVKAAGMDNEDDMVMGHMIAMAALYQSGKRQEYAENAGIAGEGSKHAHLLPKTPCVYALYDHLGRQLEQCDTEAAGWKRIDEIGKRHGMDLKAGGWKVIPIIVQKANTVWSPIWDSTGAEHELSEIHGMTGQQIMKSPDVVSAMRSQMHMQAKFGAPILEEIEDEY